MPHDVFVSYSNKDKTVADTIVASLEKNKIRCWYAPRDIKPGGDWGEEIAKAIADSSIFLLIFSESANRSQRVLDELNLAITKETAILPFRIENLAPSGAMQLHLSARHWLDAYDPSWEEHIYKLTRAVKSNMKGVESGSLPAERRMVSGGQVIQKKKKKILPAVGAVILISLGLIFGIPKMLNGNGIEAEPTLALTPEFTIAPTSDLPTETPAPAYGSAEAPIVLMFVPRKEADFDDVNSAAERIAQSFKEQNNGQIMKLIPASNEESILQALCEGKAQLGMLGAFTYLQASEQNCPVEAKLIWNAYNDIKFGGELFVSEKNKDVISLTDLKGMTLCIPEYASTSGWRLPYLELLANVGDPFTFFSDVIESGNHDKALEDVYTGVCDAGTSYYDIRESSKHPDVMEKVTVVMTTTSVPNTNITFHSDLGAELTEDLISFFNSTSTTDHDLALVSGYADPANAVKMIEINDFYYADLRDLFERSGEDPADFLN
jgi:phosphate/phosphite/phosphonate ABC transporter binding protein